MSISSNSVTSPIIVALDYPSADQALAMARQLDPKHCRVKVGKELYTRCGPAILESLHSLGFQVFLDLKFHDIPNTTANAVGVAADMGVWMVNVHASGGEAMMKACAEKLSGYPAPPLLIAVTVLTSMQQSDLKGIGIERTPLEHVRALAKLSAESGMDGVVCSSHEASSLKSMLGNDFKLVTPGIRPAFAQANDQKRIMTPAEALTAGSDYLVIGRPIKQAEDPMRALELVMAEVQLG